MDCREPSVHCFMAVWVDGGLQGVDGQRRGVHTMWGVLQTTHWVRGKWNWSSLPPVTCVVLLVAGSWWGWPHDWWKCSGASWQ